jgi:hypothetical protein
MSGGAGGLRLYCLRLYSLYLFLPWALSTLIGSTVRDPALIGSAASLCLIKALLPLFTCLISG